MSAPATSLQGIVVPRSRAPCVLIKPCFKSSGEDFIQQPRGRVSRIRMTGRPPHKERFWRRKNNRTGLRLSV